MAWRCSGRSHAELCYNLERAGIISRGPVLDAFKSVDRAMYFPKQSRELAYHDAPHPIGFNATISAPHMHATCLEALRESLIPGARVLDVGSGTGILCAVMAKLVLGGGMVDGSDAQGIVIGVEHIPQLNDLAISNIKSSGDAALVDALASGALQFVAADGRGGWPSQGPYDVIHVGAAAPALPQALLDQLAPNGVLILPIGVFGQQLKRVTKDAQGVLRSADLMEVRYVPLTTVEKQTAGEIA